MEKILSEHLGEGELIFNFDNFKLKTKFDLIIHLGKETVLYADINFLSRDHAKIAEQFKSETIEASLVGKLDEKWRHIKIDKLILINAGGFDKGKSTPLKFKVFSNILFYSEPQKETTEKSVIEFDLINFIFSGVDITYFPGGWKRDRFSVRIEGFNFEFERDENYKEIREAFRKKEIDTYITSKVRVETDWANKEKAFEIVNDICYLFSFATGNLVAPNNERHFENGILVHGQTGHCRTLPYHNDSVISDFFGITIKNFIEIAYPNFKKYKEVFNLIPVIEYYLLMKENKLLDVRCLFGFILLECLTDAAEEYYKNTNPIPDNSISKTKEKINEVIKKDEISEELIEKIASAVAYKNFSLQEVIDHIRKDFSMTYQKGDIDLYPLRKYFIHGGVFPKDNSNPIEVYHQLVNFIDRLLLHILGYKGKPYLNIKKRYEEEPVN